jgi:hypothetical protein
MPLEMSEEPKFNIKFTDISPEFLDFNLEKEQAVQCEFTGDLDLQAAEKFIEFAKKHIFL